MSRLTLVLLIALGLSPIKAQSSSHEKLPDFNRYKVVSEKKQAFFKFVSKRAVMVNQSILKDRAKIISLQKKYKKEKKLSTAETTWLKNTSKHYQVMDHTKNQPTNWSALLSKVDVVPMSLILAQAANESAWGTSRFAKKGNNLFGQWCFKKGCGLVPKRRNKGSIHEVRSFPTVKESVAAYVYNLNTQPVYLPFRTKRAQLRQQGKSLSGYTLATGLKSYSERKERYVKEIQGMIASNHLAERYPLA